MWQLTSFVIIVPRDPTRFWPLKAPDMHVFADIYAGKKLIHIKINVYMRMHVCMCKHVV